METKSKNNIKIPSRPKQKRKSGTNPAEGLRFSQIMFGSTSDEPCPKEYIFNGGPGFDFSWEQIEVAKATTTKNGMTTWRTLNITNRKNVVLETNVKLPVNEQLCINHFDMNGNEQPTANIKFDENSCTNAEYYKKKNCVFITFGTPKSDDRDFHMIQILAFSEKHVEKAEKLWSELKERRVKWFPRTDYSRDSADLRLSRVGLLYSWTKVVEIHRLFNAFYERFGFQGEGPRNEYHPNFVVVEIYNKFEENFSDFSKYGSCEAEDSWLETATETVSEKVFHPESERATKVLLEKTLLMPFQVVVKDLKDDDTSNYLFETGSDPSVKIASHSVKKVTCEKIDGTKICVHFIDSENIQNKIIIGPNHFDSITLLKFPYVPMDKPSADGEVFTVVIGSSTTGAINHYMFMEYPGEPFDDRYCPEEGDVFTGGHGYELSSEIDAFCRANLEKSAYDRIDYDEMNVMKPCSGHDIIGNDWYLEDFKKKFNEIKNRTAWGFISKISRVIFDVIPLDYYPGFEVVPMNEFAGGETKNND